MIEGISAVTLGTHEMPRAVRFYRTFGFEVLDGGEGSSFTSFRAGTSYLNLITQPTERRWFWWGRVIFYVADVDALYDRALAAGYEPATVPHDAEWGERFFYLVDPDGHELRTAITLTSASARAMLLSLEQRSKDGNERSHRHRVRRSRFSRPPHSPASARSRISSPDRVKASRSGAQSAWP
jgi:catechol 2,3-dioxygenase-like lactoylglutathione lyase family enzyme